MARVHASVVAPNGLNPSWRKLSIGSSSNHRGAAADGPSYGLIVNLIGKVPRWPDDVSTFVVNTKSPEVVKEWDAAA